MITPPVIRGGPLVRWLSLLVGLLAFAFGIVLLVESGLGLSPWDVLSQGLASRTPLTLGTANVIVAFVVLVGAWRLGARIGPGTVANAVVVGFAIDGFLAINAISALDDSALAARIGMLVGGIAVIGLGSGLYIGAALGAGPRDSLMLVLARRTRVRLGLVRGSLEAAVTVLGFALGGTVGIGTIAFVVGIGPAVELAFGLLVRVGAAVPTDP